MADATTETFEFTVTPADQAAFLLRTARQPLRLAFQAAIFATLWVAFLFIQVAIGLVGALVFAQHSLAAASGAYLTNTLLKDLADSVPVFTGFVIFLAVLNLFVIIPRQCRLLAARLMNAHPAPPGHGGPRMLRIQMLVNDRGIESRSDDERGFVAWPLVRDFSETKHRFFLMTSRSHGLVIPKVSLDDAAMDRMRATIGARIKPVRTP